MRDVLRHLERVGFDAAPRWLGIDQQGRDILTWIEGDTFAERGRMHPYLDDSKGRITFSERQVGTAMQLLRRYHDTFGADTVCHGDFGPWNIVWRRGLAHAVIDFDDVHSGERSEDVAYALRMFIGYGVADLQPDEFVRRTHMALTEYGSEFDVPRILEREYDRAEANCRRNGWHQQLARLSAEREWLTGHQSLF